MTTHVKFLGANGPIEALWVVTVTTYIGFSGVKVAAEAGWVVAPTTHNN